MSEEITPSDMPRQDEETPTIGVFKTTDRLILQPAPNGGWIVSSQNGGPEYRDELIGAYGSAAEMIAAMQAALVGHAT
jgi:hypothetical protein